MFAKATPAVPLRGIHLDLKGVPPTPRRLIESLRIMAAARVNAVLVEWEDAYPWKSCPDARSRTAYSESTLRRFFDEADALGIEVIPLVQCLGHMETFLAKKRFAHLRERPELVNELCPSKRESAEFVRTLVDDVLRTHGGRIRRFHLGGDEAWNFGTCPRCRKAVAKEGKGKLYLRHVEPMLDHLKDAGLQPILWDDMMRHWPEDDLRRLAPKAELMAWYYRPKLFGDKFQPDILDRYQKAGVALWGASAFKGADGVAMNAPNLDARSENMVAWAREAKSRGMVGAVATGWSRYNTFVLQCESLEASLDALVLAGASMWDGDLAPDAAARAEEMLVTGELAPLAGKKFLACREAARKLDEWTARRDRLIADCTWQAALWGEPERRDPLAKKPCAKLAEGWERLVKDGRKLAAVWVRAHAGLVPKVWLDRYAATRLEPAMALAATFVPRCEGRKVGAKK